MKDRKLLRIGGVYFMSSILSNLLNIILIPIYTSNLTAEQFGQYNIVVAIQGLSSIFITFSIFSGMSRFLNEYEDKNRIKNITLSFAVLWGSLVIMFGLFASSFLSNILFYSDSKGVTYIQFIIINSALLSILSIYEAYYSMQYYAFRTSAIRILKVCFTLLFSIYFVIGRGLKVEGILYSQFSSYILLVFIVIILDIRNLRIVLARRELKEQLLYGLGLVPGQVSSWILTLIDRYFIRAIISLSGVGIYSLGYKIGMLIEPVFVMPFKSVFTPFKFEVYKHADGQDKLKKMFRTYNLLGWGCIFGIAIFAKLGVSILGTPEYFEAFRVVPVIAFSYYLWGLSSFYGLGLHIANKMSINSGITVAGAIANILLNLLLIPRVGFMGAAIATVLSYLLMNIMYYSVGRNYYDLGINFLEPYKYGIVFVILYPLYLAIGQGSEYLAIEIMSNIFLCIVYVGLNVLFGFVSRKEINDVILSRNPLSKMFNVRGG